ncbi:MAG: hypothetical protein WDN72_00300 [Alphaproteobacteria bacterium]
MRSFHTRSSTSASSPARRATRARSASAKSSSPFIARSVMAATSGFLPTKSASSSMHSWAIIVESMSAMKSFFSRCSSGWIT